MTTSAQPSRTTLDGEIERTISAAIDRAYDAHFDVTGEDILTDMTTQDRWAAYTSQISDMGDNWHDVYPLARELAQLRPTTLASLWHDIAG